MIYTSILEVYNSRNKKGLIKNPYPPLKNNKIILNMVQGQSSLTKIL